MIFEQQKDSYTISTDSRRLDHQMIHTFLSERSYWAIGRSREMVERTIQNSLCFGIYHNERQVGFARVVSDFATFAWLCDVFVIEDERGIGMGKWLIECIVSHPELTSLRHFLLATRDAHGLYREYGGFIPLAEPQKWMARVKE